MFRRRKCSFWYDVFGPPLAISPDERKRAVLFLCEARWSHGSYCVAAGASDLADEADRRRDANWSR